MMAGTALRLLWMRWFVESLQILGLQTIYKIALGFGMTLSEFLDFPEMNEVEFDDFN